MPRLSTTVGQLLVNDALPEDMRDYGRTLDKKALTDLLSEVAKRYPDRYREISHNLSRVGRTVAYSTGGFSFGLKHLRPSPTAIAVRQKLQKELEAIGDDDNLTDEQRDRKILLAVGRASDGLQAKVYEESLAEGNPLAKQILSGARGNPGNLASLRAADFLYTDHRGKVLPLPVLHSYSEGLSPAEYWAGTYGARKGTMDTKFATQDAGFLSKQLNQISHRAMVVDLDGDGEPDTLRGYPVDTTDPDNEGALLSAPAGGYPRNTILTPKILSDLRQQKVGRLLVRSPLVGGTPDGGVYARDVGVREFGRLPVAGENVGLTAAQALSEPLSQAQLSSKHSGGVASSSANRATGGFALINQLIQRPKTFKGGAAHATLDGTVEHVTDAPAGGKFIQINGNQHYVAPDFELRVKRGDKVEAGDVISEGIPDPSVIVKYKGVGEGRRYFVNAFRQAFRDAGIKGHRRNMELLAKGLINHVRLTDEIGDYAPDDIVPYSAIEANYQPRQGFKASAPTAAINQYLEKPYLHYSIGTKVRPSMLKDFQEFGVKEVVTHPEPPPFEPEMIRGMANMQHDPDWITRMLGSGQKSSLLDSVHRGGYSDETGTSFVPSLAKTINFGQSGKVQTPKPNANDDQARMSKTFKVGEDLLTKQARELMEKIKTADEVSEERVKALQYVADRLEQKKQFYRQAMNRYEQSKTEPGSWVPGPSTLFSFIPQSWPTLFASGSYAPLGDPTYEGPGYDKANPETYTNGMAPQDFTDWYMGGGIRTLSKEDPNYKDFSGYSIYGDGPDDPNIAALELPPKPKPGLEIAGQKFFVNSWRPPAFEDLQKKYPNEWAEAQARRAAAPPAAASPPSNALVPYTAPSGVRMLGTPEQADLAMTDDLSPAPHWNDAPSFQPSGYGLLPLAQMAERVAPGSLNNMLQATGPMGMGSLVDIGAVGELVRGPARNSMPAPPPPPPPAPAPGAPPKVPLPGGPSPKPTTPPMPKTPTPMSPPKPRSGMPAAPASPLPKPASPVPGG